MGKITVKHYINTKINPINGEYPVYVQLTYNRKNNFIKSFTNITLSEGTTIIYSNKTITEIEKDLDNDLLKGLELIQIKLTREKIEIEKAFEIIDNRLKNKDNFKQRGIKDYLKVLMTPLEIVMTEECWIRTLQTIDIESEEDYYNFILSFNKEMNFNEALGNVENWIGSKSNNKLEMVSKYFAISNFIKKEHLKLWGTFQFLLNNIFCYGEPLLVDYFLFDINIKINNEFHNSTEIEKEEVKKEVESLIDSIIERCLLIIKKV